MTFPSIFLGYLEEAIGRSEFYKPQLCETCAKYKNLLDISGLQFQKPRYAAVNKRSIRDSAPRSIRLPCRKHGVCAGNACDLPQADTPDWKEIPFRAGPFVGLSSAIRAR